MILLHSPVAAATGIMAPVLPEDDAPVP